METGMVTIVGIAVGGGVSGDCVGAAFLLGATVGFAVGVDVFWDVVGSVVIGTSVGRDVADPGFIGTSVGRGVAGSGIMGTSVGRGAAGPGVIDTSVGRGVANPGVIGTSVGRRVGPVAIGVAVGVSIGSDAPFDLSGAVVATFVPSSSSTDNCLSSLPGLCLAMRSNFFGDSSGDGVVSLLSSSSCISPDENFASRSLRIPYSKGSTRPSDNEAKKATIRESFISSSLLLSN